MTILLTRDEFREAVFERDGHKCVICGDPAQDAHHIIERRLFTEPEEFGGYFLDNGASVCGPCHIKCEETTISIEEVREAAGIKKKILPAHLYSDQRYDKWGNPIQDNGTRLRGDLFEDESVQKILAQGRFLDDFTHYVKYPRTHHLKHSPGIHDDDRVHKSHEQWYNKDVVIHLKMDGENFTMYQDYCHARSVNSGPHESRDWAKAFHSRIQGNIPWGWRVCAENLYAKHSIAYNNLESYVLCFSIWNDKNECLDWNTTQEWFELLDVPQVPILYEGLFSEEKLREIENSLDPEKDEGYVLRPRNQFHYRDFKNCVGKYVRKDHIKTVNHHWRFEKITPNKLRG